MPKRTGFSCALIAGAMMAPSACGNVSAEPRRHDSSYLFEKFVGMMR